MACLPLWVSFLSSHLQLVIDSSARELDVVISETIDALAGAGENVTIGSFTLGTTDETARKASREARRLAVADAISLAELFADAASVTLGDLISLVDRTSSASPLTYAGALRRARSASAPRPLDAACEGVSRARKRTKVRMRGANCSCLAGALGRRLGALCGPFATQPHRPREEALGRSVGIFSHQFGKEFNGAQLSLTHSFSLPTFASQVTAASAPLQKSRRPSASAPRPSRLPWASSTRSRPSKSAVNAASHPLAVANEPRAALFFFFHRSEIALRARHRAHAPLCCNVRETTFETPSSKPMGVSGGGTRRSRRSAAP